MPRSLKWSQHERQMACRAWCEVIERQGNSGNDATISLTKAHMIDALFRRFGRLAPLDHDKCRYAGRGQSNMWAYLRDEIFPDVKRFCRGPLKRVLDEYYAKKHPFLQNHPFVQQHVINIAVAMHLKVATEVSEEHKDFHANKWANLLAWQELCKSPRFVHTTSTALAGLNDSTYVHVPIPQGPDLRGGRNLFGDINPRPTKRRRDDDSSLEEEEEENQATSNDGESDSRDGGELVTGHPIMFQISTIVDQMKFAAKQLESFNPDLKVAVDQVPNEVNDLYPVVNQIYPIVNGLFPILNKMHTSVGALRQRTADKEKEEQKIDDNSDTENDLV